MYLLDLNKTWKLRYEKLYFDKTCLTEVVNRKDGWLDVETLPCDVHVPLIKNGVIDDPVVADNCVKCEWIEDKSWWFKKEFDAGREWHASHSSELVVEGLDVKADLFLNGVFLGHHESSFYPFRKDVKDTLQQGTNVLVIRVTSGLEHFSELDLSKIKEFISCEYKSGRGPRGDNRRVFVRKPSYVYGWDWNPRIATCGIMGHARLEAYDEIAIRCANVSTLGISEDHQRAEVSVEVEIENLCLITTLDATIQLDVIFGDTLIDSIEKDLFMTSGLNHVTFDLTIREPMLWWPNGMGEQHLYKFRLRARTSNRSADEQQVIAGIRVVTLNTDRIDDRNRLFAMVVNGKRVFCKGGNWITPDSIYGRITDDKYEQLVIEAACANFNMLRVNGVCGYERDCFYDYCDRHGILIWQDFAFSCAAYPDDLAWFRQEVEKEVEFQTRRLRNHPCMALWCGNNECQGMLVLYLGRRYWEGDKKPASPGGTLLYNDVIPRIIHRNSPHIPYWNSSPFGGVDLQSNECGDRHHWDCFMNEDVGKRIVPEEYDKIACKFVSEFGCVGPTKRSSLYKYHGGESVDADSSIWKMHTNTFEKNTLKAGIMKHYADPASLSLDEYLLYAGLFQGLTLGYAFESMRCAEHNYGALMWSYNDCWGEIGWSIVDYYLIRKIAYYFVKRALAHQKLVMRVAQGGINIMCLNDTSESLHFDLEYGYVSFDGRKHDTAAAAVTVPPFAKAIVTRMQKQSHDILSGLYYARLENGIGIIPATLRTTDFRALRRPRPTLSISDVQSCREDVSFTVSSDKYVHGVHFGLDDSVRLSDEYFDLLPGEARRISGVWGDCPAAMDGIQARYVGQPGQFDDGEGHS